MTARITPTRGRMLYFRPARESLKAGDHVRIHTLENGRPQFAAMIVDVHEYDGRINITWFDHAGVQRTWGPVPIWQEGDPPMADEVSYCEWMPYQKKVASGEIEPTLHSVKADKLYMQVTLADMKLADTAAQDLDFLIKNRRDFEGGRVPTIAQMQDWLKLVRRFLP